jgi:hypothetical protein
MSPLPSRNENFDLYEDPKFRRARRVQRLLENLRQDLDRTDLRLTLRVRPVRAGSLKRYRIEYDNSEFRCARISYLTHEELITLRNLLASQDGLPTFSED